MQKLSECYLVLFLVIYVRVYKLIDSKKVFTKKKKLSLSKDASFNCANNGGIT